MFVIIHLIDKQFLKILPTYYMLFSSNNVFFENNAIYKNSENPSGKM